MGRYGNYPTTVEDCLSISIKKLKEWEYLKYNGTKSGVISWSRNDISHSKINIDVRKNDYTAFMILSYNFNGTPMNYQIEIITKHSNLGKGLMYFFLCPKTGKFCRKLILMNGYFLHREAFKGLMYAKQIEAKKARELHFIFDKIYIREELYEERYKKYFKTHYNGKETKRFKRLNHKIQLAESYPAGTMERLLLM